MDGFDRKILVLDGHRPGRNAKECAAKTELSRTLTLGVALLKLAPCHKATPVVTSCEENISKSTQGIHTLGRAWAWIVHDLHP